MQSLILQGSKIETAGKIYETTQDIPIVFNYGFPCNEGYLIPLGSGMPRLEIVKSSIINAVEMKATSVPVINEDGIIASICLNDYTKFSFFTAQISQCGMVLVEYEALSVNKSTPKILTYDKSQAIKMYAKLKAKENKEKGINFQITFFDINKIMIDDVLYDFHKADITIIPKKNFILDEFYAFIVDPKAEVCDETLANSPFEDCILITETVYVYDGAAKYVFNLKGRKLEFPLGSDTRFRVDVQHHSFSSTGIIELNESRIWHYLPRCDSFKKFRSDLKRSIQEQQNIKQRQEIKRIISEKSYDEIKYILDFIQNSPNVEKFSPKSLDVMLPESFETQDLKDEFVKLELINFKSRLEKILALPVN